MAFMSLPLCGFGHHPRGGYVLCTGKHMRHRVSRATAPFDRVGANAKYAWRDATEMTSIAAS
ncbi:hypothetical protein Trco_002219 [Trichoderma cornu-damae]|uniref:Uncharacterized protein n=1 Tax=Trichoderma cornu-damae TaxID=654480 RepID=A0A9P8TXT6_9HYPO|nr:hypothetical protein Trco_002219 [Trichoderma cornu-damae]